MSDPWIDGPSGADALAALTRQIERETIERCIAALPPEDESWSVAECHARLRALLDGER